MQVVLLLDGRPLGRYTFASGVLRTAEPVAWALSDGRGTARVQLTLAFGAALGYGRYKGAPAIRYVGPQANGVLWADPADAPLDWPICPPQVAGKVRSLTRSDAAYCPGGSRTGPDCALGPQSTGSGGLRVPGIMPLHLLPDNLTWPEMCLRRPDVQRLL